MSRRTLTALLVCALAALSSAPAGAAERSSGCGGSPPTPPQTFEVAGQERRAIVALPQDYRADRPHALIFAFHGRTSDNARARRYFGLEQAADRPAIHVYPAGLRDRTARFTWADPGDPPDALRDGDKANPLLWCPHTQDHTPHGRFYPHQWPRGAAEAILTFFATLAG
jgi:polyhydroxybutyrate depolymerase